ncbi:MAG: Gfo/Idh/MocA family oxidoreductase [Lentisphaeria bacterium]|nr:Gfo/Idh/MocA family oxidoreductase [Lentisphaeria bacterium]
MSVSTRMHRRAFLKAAGSAAPLLLPGRVWGAAAPSNRIVMGAIGVGSMGSGNLKGFLHSPNTQVVAVCDVDAGRRDSAKASVEKRYAEQAESGAWKGCAAHTDFREITSRDDIDAVCISTADHWHVLCALHAVAAGKDVYCEKPLSVTVEEGRVLADAVRRYGRVFLMGSQQRSEWRFRHACELVRNGRIGQVKHVKVGLSKGKSHPPVSPMPVPGELDYDLWLGPARQRPYHKDCVHYNFRFISDFSGGQMLNWGSHHLDIAQWGLGSDRSGPVQVSGKGVFPTDGPYDNPIEYSVDYVYGDGVTLNCSTSNRGGTHWEGTEGWVFVTRGRIDAEPKSLLKSVIRPEEIHLVDSRNHKGHFLDCIRTRAETVAPCEVGHRSASMGHIGNIAMILGRRLRWDPRAERFVNDAEANRMLGRAMRGPWGLT